MAFTVANQVQAGVGGGVGASASQTTSASANVVSPITLTNNVGLSFGTFAPSTNPGTVTVDVAGGRSVVNVGAAGGTVTAAIFSVGGETGNIFDITLPSSTSIDLVSGGGDPMTVDSFVSVPATSGTLFGGASSLFVGATLNVNANQTAGSYEGNFDVTVAYQ